MPASPTGPGPAFDPAWLSLPRHSLRCDVDKHVIAAGEAGAAPSASKYTLATVSYSCYKRQKAAAAADGYSDSDDELADDGDGMRWAYVELDRQDAIQLTTAVSSITPGFEIGLRSMVPGERAVVVVPPEMAFGRDGAPGRVGKHDVLFFDVLLKALCEGVAVSPDVIKFVQSVPDAPTAAPTLDSTVTVNMMTTNAVTGGKSQMVKRVFVVGGEDSTEAEDKLVMSMRVKELATAQLNGVHVFISVAEVQPPAETYGLSSSGGDAAGPAQYRCSLPAAQRAEAAKGLKDQGNRLLERRMFNKALRKYQLAQNVFLAEPSLLAEPADAAGQAQHDAYCRAAGIILNNKARALSQLGDAEAALAAVNASIDVLGRYAKAYFLRAQLLRGLKRYAEARADVATLEAHFAADVDAAELAKELARIAEDEEAMSD
jgi:hypothetical protein